MTKETKDVSSVEAVRYTERCEELLVALEMSEQACKFAGKNSCAVGMQR